jgi:hypothetical protein
VNARVAARLAAFADAARRFAARAGEGHGEDQEGKKT